MSEAPKTNPPAEAAVEPTTPPSRKIGLTRLVLVLCGLILAITGLIKFGQGMVQMFSGANEEIQRLVKESDSALLSAQERIQAAAPALQTLEAAINSEPLAAIRSNRGAEFKQAAEEFHAAADQIRAAAAKLDETKQYSLTETGRLFVEAKGKWCRTFAELADVHGQMIDAVLDESIVDQQQVVEKMLKLAEQRNAAELAFKQLNAELEKLLPADQKPG